MSENGAEAKVHGLMDALSEAVKKARAERSLVRSTHHAPSEPMVVRRVSNGSGSHVEPPCDDRWSDLDRLRWHAAVVALDTGLRVRVEPGSERGRFTIYVGSAGVAPLSFGTAWAYLSGVSLGADQARPIKEDEIGE